MLALATLAARTIAAFRAAASTLRLLYAMNEDSAHPFGWFLASPVEAPSRCGVPGHDSH
jgi:hypothetical protein